MKRDAAFTLIELLIVLSLTALVGASLYSMFASAVDLMRRASHSVISEDASLFLEKLDREISSQVVFKGISFEGREESLSFASRIETDKKTPMNKGIGRVSFFLNKSHGTLERRQENLSQIYKEEDVYATPVLKGVTRVKFRYFVYNKPEKKFEWTETWNSLEKEGAIPAAVKIEFECTMGEERHGFERTTAIPIAESAR